MAPVSDSTPPPESTDNCLSARAYSPAKQSSSNRKVRCALSDGCSRKYAVSTFSASLTFPAANSSLAVTCTVSPLARELPRLERQYVEALVDETLQAAVFLWVVADLDRGEGEADRLHRVFAGTGKLDGRDQRVL